MQISRVLMCSGDPVEEPLPCGLPLEVWDHIFSFLDDASRSSFSKVCWDLYDVALAHERRSMHFCIRRCALLAERFLGAGKMPSVYFADILEEGVMSGLLSISDIYQRAFATMNYFALDFAKSWVDASLFSRGDHAYYWEKDRRAARFLATMVFRVGSNLLPQHGCTVAVLRQRIRSCDLSFARASLEGHLDVFKALVKTVKTFSPLEAKRWWHFVMTLPQGALSCEDRDFFVTTTQKKLLSLCYRQLHHRHVHESCKCVCSPDVVLDDVVEIFSYLEEGSAKRLLAYQIVADLAYAGRVGQLWHFACDYGKGLLPWRRDSWMAGCAVLAGTFLRAGYKEALFFADAISSDGFSLALQRALEGQQEARGMVPSSILIVSAGVGDGAKESAALEASLRGGSMAKGLPKILGAVSLLDIFKGGDFGACATLLQAIERLDDRLLTRHYSFILEVIHIFLVRLQRRDEGVHDTYQKTAFGTLLSISVYWQRALPKRCHTHWLEVVNRWIFREGVFHLAAWDLLTAPSHQNLEVMRRAENFVFPFGKALSEETLTNIFLDLVAAADDVVEGVAFELLAFVNLRGKSEQKCFWVKGIYDKFPLLRPFLSLMDDFNFNPILRPPSCYKVEMVQRSIIEGNRPE